MWASTIFVYVSITFSKVFYLFKYTKCKMKNKTCMQFENENIESSKAGTALTETGVFGRASSLFILWGIQVSQGLIVTKAMDMPYKQWK